MAKIRVGTTAAIQICMKKQILAIVSLLIVSTSAFAGSTACDKEKAPHALSAYLKSLGDENVTTEEAMELGGQELNVRLTALVGDDVPAKASMTILKLENYLMLANCFNSLLGYGELKPEFKAKKDKKKKIMTDNEEYLSMGYPSLEDAKSEEDKHHAKVRSMVMEHMDSIAFVQAFFDGTKYLEKK